MGFVYCLIDPESMKPRYVGQTIKSLKYRLNEHIQDSKRSRCHNANWIKSILKKELRPIIEMVEECDNKDLNSREIYYIKHFRDNGVILTNSNDGGQTGSCKFHKEESKKKISDFMKNYKKSPEHILRMRKSLSKPVYQYSLNGKFIRSFNNAEEAGNCINKSKTSITKACGRSGCSGGFQWRYYEVDEISQKIMYYKSDEFKEKIKVTNKTRVLNRISK